MEVEERICIELCVIEASLRTEEIKKIERVIVWYILNVPIRCQ